MPVHIPIVGDIRLVLSTLAGQVRNTVPEAWLETLRGYKRKHPPRGEARTDSVEPRVFIRDLSAMMEEDAILAADVGQNQIWSARNFNVKEGRFLTSGGLGTMGYSIPAAIGAKLAKPKRQVVAVCGDGSFQMSMCELGTICQDQVDVKIILMQNGRLGMVKELQDRLYGGRHIATTLDGNPRLCQAGGGLRHPGPAGGLQRGGQGLRRRDAADKGPLPAGLHRGSQYPEHLISAFWPSEPMAKLRGQKGARFMKYTLSVLVENHPASSQKSPAFSPAAASISHSLAVGVTENPAISRITIVVNGDEYIVEQVEKQLNKVIPVIKVKVLEADRFISCELSLIKVSCQHEAARGDYENSRADAGKNRRCLHHQPDFAAGRQRRAHRNTHQPAAPLRHQGDLPHRYGRH